MSNQFAVNGPTPIYPAALQTAITIKNTGTETVYLSPSPIPSLGVGLALGVGSSIIWDAKNPLYAYATAGILTIVENSGNLFDAQAIAVEILAGGLAQDIANSISITGAPTIVRYDNIASGSITSGSAMVVIPLQPTYSAIRLTLQAGSTISRTSFMAMNVSMGSSAMDLYAVSDVNLESIYTFQVTGTDLYLAPAWVGAGSLRYWVEGIVTPTPPQSPIMLFNGDNTLSGAATISDLRIQPNNGVTFKLTGIASASGRIWIPINSGRTHVSFKVTGGSAGASLQFNVPLGGAYNTVDIINTTGGNNIQKDIVLPAIPLDIYYSFGTGATTAEISIQPF